MRRARALALAAGLGLAVSGATIGGGIRPAHADTCTSATEYDYTGTEQCFQVPAGVTSVTFDIFGAQGGAGGSITVGSHTYAGGTGALGGETKATVAVHPLYPILIVIGQQGGTGSSDGQSGSGGSTEGRPGGDLNSGHGGSGQKALGGTAASGGGGGGFTLVGLGGGEADVLVAGAGGGGGGAAIGTDTSGDGGAGGGARGGNGSANSGSTSATPGGGATSTENDPNAILHPQGGSGDFSGQSWLYAEGTGGDGDNSNFGWGGGGGGGGGGLYGGGAGYGNKGGFAGAGGGGGNGWAAPRAANVTFGSGVQAGDGKVLISYVSTVSLQSSANPSSYYQPPSLTATVSPAVSTGAVTFSIDGTPLGGCMFQPVTNGIATCTLPSSHYLSVGTQRIMATYNGSATGRGFLGSASSVLSHVVVAETQARLSVITLNGQSGLPSVSGQPVTLSATLYASGAPVQTPAGTVDFYADGKVIGSALPQSVASGSSLATLTTTSLPMGTHALSAGYRGDSTTAASVSGTSSQVVQAGTFLNDTAPSITYSGTWGYSTNRGYGDSQDDEHYTQTNNDSFGYTFSGTGIRVLGETNAGGGTDDVYVDGTKKATITTIGQDRLAQQVLYSIGGLPSGTHTIKVVKTSGGFLEVDALAIVQ